MSGGRAFGLLLFGGIIVLTASRQSGFLRGINLKNTRKYNSKNKDSNGDFVVRGSKAESRIDGRWKKIGNNALLIYHYIFA
jgi:hypothetical protein